MIHKGRNNGCFIDNQQYSGLIKIRRDLSQSKRRNEHIYGKISGESPQNCAMRVHQAGSEQEKLKGEKSSPVLFLWYAY